MVVVAGMQTGLTLLKTAKNNVTEVKYFGQHDFYFMMSIYIESKTCIFGPMHIHFYTQLNFLSEFKF